MALDRFGRKIHYLRISLTDHCNLRCVYCMPENQTFRPNADMLQDDEILLLARLFAELGFEKIRLTGGEPTVRARVVDLVRGIASTPGIDSLSMTTNGILLPELAQPLKDAGLQRVNISIDSLDPQKFHRLTRWGRLDDVWNGILAAEAAGLTPIKLNAVVVNGYNEDDVVDLAGLTLEHPWQMRYIEMMPFGGVTELQKSQVVTAAQIQEIGVSTPRIIGMPPCRADCSRKYHQRGVESFMRAAAVRGAPAPRRARRPGGWRRSRPPHLSAAQFSDR